MSDDRNVYGGFSNGAGMGASATEQVSAGVGADDGQAMAAAKVASYRQAQGRAPLADASLGSSGVWFANIVIFFLFGWLGFVAVPSMLVRAGYSLTTAGIGCVATLAFGIYLMFRVVIVSRRKVTNRG